MYRDLQKWAARCAALMVGTSLVVGCADKTPPPSERVDNPAAGTAEKPSNLSYGTVTAKLFPGVADRMSAKQVEDMTRDEPPRDPEGTLNKPSEDGRVHGDHAAAK